MLLGEGVSEVVVSGTMHTETVGLMILPKRTLGLQHRVPRKCRDGI